MKKGFIIALLAIVATVGNVFSQSMIISAGYDHAVAICDKGQIYAWGRNSHNKLCLEDQTIGEVVSSPSRVKIDPNLTFSQVSAGSGGHNVALSCKSTVYCWGENDKEQCGRDGATYEYINNEPVPVYKGEVEQGYTLNGEASATGEYLGGVVYVCGTTNASMAILADGTAVWWGSNPLLGAGSTSTPKYIRDEDGQKLQNVVQIMGGDDNILIVVGDNPDDQVGTVYSAGQGTLNGRGGVEDKFAKPVEIAKDENGQRSSGEFLRNVRTTGIADNAAFAVDGTTGYVYGWGDNSWGCTATGANPRSAFKYAAKVASGEYESISGLPFLTDVKQVIGGNGTGAAITEEGYLLWWGTNDAGSGSGNSGGVVPNSDYATVGNTCETGGPVFANYCAGEKGPTEVRVDDAISIGRGDLASFMVNAEGKYYVWGASNIAGKNEFYGIMGTGIKNDLSTCLKEIILPCPSRDICPEAYMNGPKYKCPGIKDSLYCGFSPVDKVESGKNVKWRYFFRWFKDGNLLNSITEDDIEKLRLKTIAELEADIYNRPAIEIEEEGVYEVEILYIGTNVPCDNCPEAKAKIQVIDMLMPIDTVIKPICLGDPLAPTAAEIFNYEYKVNGDFYNATQLTTFAIFPTIDSNDTLGVYTAYGAGGIVDDIEITGDKIKEINLNGDKESNDTTYTVWAEDITRFETKLFENSTIPTGTTGFTNYAAGNAQIIHLTTTSELLSFSLIVKAPDHGDASFTVTPKIYKTGKSEYGMYTAGELYKTGKTVGPITIPAGKLVDTVIKCNIILEANSVRGGDYILHAEPQKVGTTDISWYTQTVAPSASLQYATPYEDSNNTGITATGAIVGFKEAPDQCQGGTESPYFNITFGKMTDYTCGRIPLTARLECPPCNNPKKLEIISTSHTIKTDVDPKYKKVVELCKESDPLDLDIEPLVGQTDPNAKFDILWYDKDPQKNAAATALKKDETGTVNTLLFSTDWATVAGATDITEDAEKVYYVYVHDHEKVGCPNYDSIKVIAHPVPADTLVWDTFCLTSRLDEPRFVASPLINKDIHWVGDDPTVASVWASITAPTTFDYTITDKVTTCVGETHSYTVTVNSTEKPDVDPAPSTTVDATGSYALSLAVLTQPATGFEIRWYDENKLPLSSKNVSRAQAGQYTFYAELYNTVTECASEMVEVILTINDALPPRVANESLCLTDKIPDLSEYVTKNLKVGETDADYELLWYSDINDATPITSFDPTFDASVKGEGEFTLYVSQRQTAAPHAESAKVPLTITVHKVATLDLSANETNYCLSDAAQVLTATANNDGDYTAAMWGISKKSETELSSPVATMSPTTTTKGVATYYVLPEFQNADRNATKSYASAVCYGAIQDIDINVFFTDIPNADKPTVDITYLKAQGDAAGGRYETLLTQDPTAVTPDDAGYELLWYDINGQSISEPAPTYIANETGERKEVYYVTQKKITAPFCESEKKKVTAVISSIPQPKVKSITLCQGSAKLNAPFKLEAEINTANGAFPATNFELLWYKEDPDNNPSARSYTYIDLSEENLVYDYTRETEKDFPFYVRQREIAGNQDMSPTATLVVSIYSKPILKTTQPDPICKGEFVDIKNLYEISNRIDNKTYESEYLSASGNDPVNGIAKENGTYKSRAYFTLESGETCVSDWANITLTVNELSAEIVGDLLTCPNIGKEMQSVLTTNNMLATDLPTYNWSVSPTGEQGNDETFQKSSMGLANEGDKVTITLTVEMGACRETASHTLTVQDPGVNGQITFDEDDNTNSGGGFIPLSKSRIVEFDGCNKKVNVQFEVDNTESEFTYKNLLTGDERTGTFTNRNGEIDVKAGKYEVSYINTCKTSFQFEIIDKSLDILTTCSNLEVCEGEPWHIEIFNGNLTPFIFDPAKYKKIEWKKDNDILTTFSNKSVLDIPSTTAADNGVYSCQVQSSGCTSTIVIAMGGSFKSKPNVKVNSSLLENGGTYEVVRGKDKSITIPLLNPTSAADLAKLESNTNDGIIWKENGVKVNSGSTYDLNNIVEDHIYNVVIANGGGGSNDDFCGTAVNINIKVDALLAIKASMVDENGKETADMCINETGTGILIDTTGTGKLLHPDKLELKVVEKIGSKTKDIAIKKKDQKLFAEISPSESATYDIVYKYSVGNQDSSKTASITVHPAYQVDWDRTVRLCDGESGYIKITKKEPAEVTLTWESNACLTKGTENGANVEAIFSGDGLKEERKLVLVASNNGICADKKYYPSFIVDKEIEGEIVAPEYICVGHEATLNAKYDATEYVWSSPEQLGEGVTLQGASVNVTPRSGYASYTVDMKRGACTQTGWVDVEVREAPEFDHIDSLTYRAIEIILQSNTGSEPFQYLVDGQSDENVLNRIKENLEYGEHLISVIDDAQCRIDTTIYINSPGIEIPIVVSPNDDKVHDAFIVPNLREAYPDAKIRIYDRWGKKLTEYRAGDEGMDWDGTYNGTPMPSTDYWYEIEIKEILKTYTGHFTLIRQ